MEGSNFSGLVGEYNPLPSAARLVRILLVDHDTTSLISLASRFEEQSYIVTTTESANVALSLFRERKIYYDIVIADRLMPEMDIYEFVRQVHHHRTNIPIMLIDENKTVDSVTRAMHHGVCYVFSKPLSRCDIATIWQNIPRMTREMPSHIDVEKYANPSTGSSRDEAAINKKQSNLEMNLINTDRENMKRRKNQISEDSNFPVDTNEHDGCNPKKSRMTWTFHLHQKFLKAIQILGEDAAHPKMLLTMMNEPDLTYRQVSSHLQKHRDRERHSVNLQRNASRVMPPVLPGGPLSIFTQGQTSGTANLNCKEAHGASQIPRSPSWLEPQNVFGYGLDSVKENLETLNYSGNNSMNAIIANGGVHIPEGSGGGQIAQGIGQNHDANENYCANIQKQAQMFPRSFSHGTMAGGPKILGSRHLSNGLQHPNHEPAGATFGVIPSGGQLSNILQAPNQEQAGATSNVVIASGHMRNSLQAQNQESAGDIGIGMYGLGKAGNPGNMHNYNFGEGSSANQLCDGIPSEDDLNIFMEELENSKFWDYINET